MTRAIPRYMRGPTKHPGRPARSETLQVPQVTSKGPSDATQAYTLLQQVEP
jgi:hypothetical protein